MSRCFPFPPPRYEKTARPDGQLASAHLHVDKEKHKEKKHKKDKKDKERKEGKEKKDKERSKDKHRDKKDRKEKHKDKKKDKSKDKSRELEEGTERHSEALHGQKVGESSRKSEENKDPRSREDLVRKIQNDKGATTQSVQNVSVSNERGRQGFSAAPALENERTAANKMHIHSINASRKTEGSGEKIISINQQKNGTAIRRGDNITSSSQRTSDVFIAAPTAEKERVKVARPLSNSTDSAPKKEGMGQRISNISILVQKRTESPNKETARKETSTSSPLLPSPAIHKGNGKVGRPMEIAPASTQRFDSPSTSSTGAGTDRGMPRSTIPSPSITIRRPNGLVRPPENISISSKKPDAGGASPAMGKEKELGARIQQNNVIDQKLVNSKPPIVEKIADGRAERMEKVRDVALDNAKKEDKKRDRHEKKKRKEKDKHKEKKKEKEAKKEKEEQNNNKEHDKLGGNNINYQVDNSLHTKSSAPPLAPPADDAKTTPADENLKKRKNHEMNGYLQNHHDMRPTKLPRPALSNTHVENGSASHVAAPLSSVKPEAINIEKAERLHKKEEKINGNQEGQRSSIEPWPQDPLAASENTAPSKKLPHPDSKYLSQIYIIPEALQMMEWHGHDDQDWLFDHDSTRPKNSNSETEADGAPQVWAQPLKIDQADVIALPYVIPF
uniref:Uncharacterized protein n=1 Tax=Leersia perrieri TaxID=77586 RepID=A0A0D9W1C4_9ORYZ